jgi:hypothetical protein
VSDSLPHSREADVASNREARISARQLLGLWYSGLWRLIVGLPIAVIAAAVAWQVPLPSIAVANFFFMAIGIGLAGYGSYLLWRAFSFLGDAITRRVTYVTGPLDSQVKTSSKGAKSYFMSVGPVKAQIYRKNTFEALPVGLDCHVYYTAGSMHLLSIEPATAGEPHPSLLHFDGDPAHAWDRLRLSVLIPAVAVFGFAVGAHNIISAHPAHWATISGHIIEYHETHGKGAARYFSIDSSSQEYNLSSLENASPPAPPLDGYIGDSVDLYVNSDSGADILAMRLRETLYRADLYLYPEHQFWGMIWSGAWIAVLSAAVLAVLVWWTRYRRRNPAAAMTDIERRSHDAMHM